MSSVTLLLIVLCALSMASVSSAQGRDWFVREGSAGDGSQASPFGDSWEALSKCEAGDAIHVAAGRYTGKLQTGEWVLPFDRVQLLGGYSPDWSERNPWKHLTCLVWDRSAKNYPKEARLSSSARDVVIDGLVLDVMEQNEYLDEQRSGRSDRSLGSGIATVRLWLPGTVRNCVFVNSGREGLVCPNGSTVENNLFLNTFDSALKINGLPPASPDAKKPAVVRKNTFVWSWCDRAPATGRYSGAGVHLAGPATLAQNIFAHCDNNAIYCGIDPDRTSVSGNVFFMNLWSNFKMFVEGRDVAVDDESMHLLEECGLKSCDGNLVLNPELPLDPAWLDGAAKRTAPIRGKVEMDEWNQLRQALGLDLIGGGGAPATGIAPAYPLEKALALMSPGKSGLEAGARAVSLEARFGGAAAAAPARSYRPAELAEWARKPDQVEGQALEMVVALSNVANVSMIPAAYKPAEHAGIFLHDADGKERITGFFRKGSAASRTADEAAGKYNGTGKATRLFVVRGTAHSTKNVPKAAFFIESIAPYEPVAAARKRAQGRDWFVRAGASGGDGSREKPFRDPFQALERCEAGDTIHVAQGEYVGKLRAGHWVVDCPDIALLGGYDAEFERRDPWRLPSLLYTPEDFKGMRASMTLEGSDDHTGCIVDGFVFDKKLNNKYQANGDLMVRESEKKPHLWLSSPGCVVRNCVFVNGSEGAIRVGSAQTVENCIFLNHYLRAVVAQLAHDQELPFVFRNNTVAFAWEPLFGQGMGRQGDLLVLEGGLRAIVDGNIFEFADNHAIRLDAEPKDVELTNNVFAHNLWAEVYRTAGSLVVDNNSFGALRELGWKRIEGNLQLIPGLPLEQSWFDVYLNRTAYVPGKVELNDWNQLRDMLGQPMIRTGGTAESGVAPAYDWKKALELFPSNPACKAGARRIELAVKFDGIERTRAEHEYAETSWDVARNESEWSKLEGQRVMLVVAVKSSDNQWFLGDVPQAQHLVWAVGGPQGNGSPGLPLRVYVQRGTRFERVLRQAKGYGTGPAEETYWIKGIARGQRQLVVEAVERAE